MTRAERYKHLLDLMNIPEIEDVIFLNLGVMERQIPDKIARYKNLQKKFHRTQRENIMIFENDRTIEKRKAYEFKLQRDLSSGKWQIIYVEPSPNIACEEMVPPEFIATMDSFRPEPNEIHSRRNFYSKSLKKYFTLTFCKYNDHHVIGNIFESTKKPQKEREEKRPTCIHFSNIKFKENPDLEKLIYYMQRYPSIQEKVLSHFKVTILPLMHEADENLAT